MSELQKHIDAISDHFDFGKVQKVMSFLNWEWVGSEEGVPTEAELRQQVRRLMTDAWNRADGLGEDYGTGTGGFWVQYYYEENFFEVTFQLAQWTSEYLQYD